MAKFSTKAASALERVLKRETLVDFPGIISFLEAALRNKQAQTAKVEKEAARILEVETYMDGTEILDKGRLFYNLTENLDEEDIPRAIAIAKSVQNLMSAAREVWLLDLKTKHEAGRYPKKWEDAWVKNKGPGAVVGEFKG